MMNTENRKYKIYVKIENDTVCILNDTILNDKNLLSDRSFYWCQPMNSETYTYKNYYTNDLTTVFYLIPIFRKYNVLFKIKEDKNAETIYNVRFWNNADECILVNDEYNHYFCTKEQALDFAKNNIVNECTEIDINNEFYYIIED